MTDRITQRRFIRLDRLPSVVDPGFQLDLLRSTNGRALFAAVVEHKQLDSVNAARNSELQQHGIVIVWRAFAGPTIRWMLQIPEVAVVELADRRLWRRVRRRQSRVIRAVVVHGEVDCVYSPIAIIRHAGQGGTVLDRESFQLVRLACLMAIDQHT